MKVRNLFLCNELTSELLNITMQNIIEFETECLSENEEGKINLFINSNGGDIISTLALIDVMTSSSLKIDTVCLGQCSSSAFLIFVSGNKRYIGKNAYCMIHNGYIKLEGNLTDLKSSLENMENLEHKVNKIIKNKTSEGLLDLLVQNDSEIYFDSTECVNSNIADEYFKGIEKILKE